MGLSAIFLTAPLGDIADDGLAAVVYSHMLHGDFLLAAVAVFAKRLHLSRKRARKFVELGIRPKKAIEPLSSLEALPRELQEIADEDEIDSTKQPPENETKTLQ